MPTKKEIIRAQLHEIQQITADTRCKLQHLNADLRQTLRNCRTKPVADAFVARAQADLITLLAAHYDSLLLHQRSISRNPELIEAATEANSLIADSINLIIQQQTTTNQ